MRDYSLLLLLTRVGFCSYNSYTFKKTRTPWSKYSSACWWSAFTRLRSNWMTCSTVSSTPLMSKLNRLTLVLVGRKTNTTTASSIATVAVTALPDLTPKLLLLATIGMPRLSIPLHELGCSINDGTFKKCKRAHCMHCTLGPWPWLQRRFSQRRPTRRSTHKHHNTNAPHRFVINQTHPQTYREYVAVVQSVRTMQHCRAPTARSRPAITNRGSRANKKEVHHTTTHRKKAPQHHNTTTPRTTNDRTTNGERSNGE